MQDFEKLGQESAVARAGRRPTSRRCRAESPPEALGLLAPLVSVLVGSCATGPSMNELDARVRESGAKTIVLGERLSLYSPYDLIRTRQYLELIEKQREEVFALFGVENERPLVVQLHPNESLGVQFSVEGDRIGVKSISEVTDERVNGQATIDLVIVEVDPIQVLHLGDGRALPGAFEASMYADTIRHELTHVATTLLGSSLNNWLSEGVAHAVELIPIENGRFGLDPVPEVLSETAKLPHESRSLEALLDWRQGFPVTSEDVSARRLALSLVLFALERDGAPTLREGVLRLATRDRREFLALAAEWSAWLDRCADPPATSR